MHCTSLHKEKALFFSFFLYFVWYITSVQKWDLSFFKLCTLYRKGKALFFLSSFYIFYGTYYPGPGPKAGLEFFLILCTSYCKGKALVFWGIFLILCVVHYLGPKAGLELLFRGPESLDVAEAVQMGQNAHHFGKTVHLQHVEELEGFHLEPEAERDGDKWKEARGVPGRGVNIRKRRFESNTMIDIVENVDLNQILTSDYDRNVRVLKSHLLRMSVPLVRTSQHPSIYICILRIIYNWHTHVTEALADSVQREIVHRKLL